FALDGVSGLLEELDQRLEARSHAVILVAEGAGQHWVGSGDATDASGNKKLGDVGVFLRDRIRAHFEAVGRPVSVKYIDPSYTIRSLPANAWDAHYCNALGQHAVHAALGGFTNAMVGRWNSRFTVVPLHLVTRRRRQLDPEGDTWQLVVQTTGQPDLSGRSPNGRG
ncbi:MAG: ATP-dependent 6-phosphofructokinase, partial [Acidimicrobiia bacterium]|nr:ATP-dependent 6-phosphofructokinase [Acidimicrobiia bacterium]